MMLGDFVANPIKGTLFEDIKHLFKVAPVSMLHHSLKIIYPNHKLKDAAQVLELASFGLRYNNFFDFEDFIRKLK